MNFRFIKSAIKIKLIIVVLFIFLSCEEEITQPEISTPLDVVLSVEVFVLDKELGIYPKTNIEISFHEMIKLNSSVKQEEFYKRITCPKGWVIERRSFQLNENEEIYIGVTADSLNTSNYTYKSINYNQLAEKADSNNSVLLFFPFTIYR